MTRLRVLFMTAWYPTTGQPVAGVFVREHAKAVSLHDDVVVVHLAGCDPGVRGLWRIERETDPELTEGIPTYRVRHGRPAPKTGLPLYVASAWAAYRRVLLDGFAPDVIHAHVFHAGFPAVLLGRRHGIPVVVTEHFTGFPRGLLSRRDVRLARFTFQNAHRVLPVSLALQRSIEGYGIHARFVVVPNAVDTDLFYPADPKRRRDGPKRLLFVGLMARGHVKGVPQLLEALARVQRRDWHLDLVGDGVARQEYEDWAARLGLGDMVTFHGLQTKAEVARRMREADLLVVPSYWETFSVVAAEALVSGLPVVATRCGGPEELVSPDSGALVRPGDTAELATALIESLDKEPGDWGAFAQRARERFGPEAVGARLHSIYRSVMAPTVGPSLGRVATAGPRWMHLAKKWFPTVYSAYGVCRRARNRCSLWATIMTRLRGYRLRDRVTLATSAVMDTLDAALLDRSWAPCTWFPCTVVDTRCGITAAPRRRTDDVYFLLPGREQDVEYEILSPLRPGDIFVDCGAHVGYYTLRGASLVGGKGLVVAIEPVPATAARLRSNVALNGLANVRVVETAVSRPGVSSGAMAAPIRIHGMASLKPIEAVSFRLPIRSLGRVPASTLDVLCADLPHVRVLKLDVEGSELDALEGATKLLDRTDVVVCERNRDSEAIVALLAAASFKVEPLMFTTYIRAWRAYGS